MIKSQKMKAVYLFAVFVLFSGCGGSGSSSKNGGNSQDSAGMKNLPASISVSIPKTLGVSQSSSASVLNRFLSFAVVTGPAPQSLSYDNVNSIVKALKNQMASISSTLVCMDRIIDGITPSDTAVSGKSIVITQAMVDTILSLISEDQRAEYKAIYDKEGIVGKAMSIDPFLYQSVNENGYNFKYSSTGESGSMTVYWSSDKNLIKIVLKNPTYTYGINTNLSEKSSRMYIVCNMGADQSPSGTSQKTTSIISMKEVAGSSKSAVCLSSSHIDESESGIVKSFNFEGVADNDGGYIMNNYIYVSSAIPQQSSYIEGFDSTGGLTYQKNGDFVVYGEEPVSYKSMYDSAKTAIDSLQGSINNDKEITGDSSSLIAKSASGTLEGECYMIYDSNASAVADAITGYNNDPSNGFSYCDILNPHIIGLAVCDKNGSLSLFINNPTLYSAASVLYLSKYSFADSKMSNLIALDK